MLTIAISFAAGVVTTLVALVALLASLADYFDTIGAPLPPAPPRKPEEIPRRRGPSPLFRKVNEKMEFME